MELQTYEQVQQKAQTFQFSSLTYIAFEEVRDFQLLIDSSALILLYGYHQEYACYQYHFATDDLACLTPHLTSKETCFIAFVPAAWIKDLQQQGFKIRNAWHDYFLETLDTYENNDCVCLHEGDCEQISQVLMACRNQSRGFSGQSVT